MKIFISKQHRGTFVAFLVDDCRENYSFSSSAVGSVMHHYQILDGWNYASTPPMSSWHVLN